MCMFGGGGDSERFDRVIEITFILSPGQYVRIGSKFVTVPTYICFKTSVIVFIITKQKRSTHDRARSPYIPIAHVVNVILITITPRDPVNPPLGE